MAKKRITKLIIEGTIQKINETYSQDWLLKTIENAGKDKMNAAIIAYINSPGGSVFESDEVYEALKKYSSKYNRPVYAYFAAVAASGGYYIGCAAKKIFANKNTLTGSIGVIAGQFIDLSQLMKKHGIKTDLIHAGKNKCMGHFSQPATAEQKQIMQSIADECYEQFTSLVAESRNLSLSKVKKLADGRIYTAMQAKKNGLVDEVVSFDDAVSQIKEEMFGDKDADVDVREEKFKSKGFMTKLKGMKAQESGIEMLVGLMKSKVSFPAYYWGREGM